MSRTTYNPVESYTGTGSLAAYTFSFKIEAKKQLLVIEVDENGVQVKRVRGTDTTYLSSVEFDAVNGGGTVTLAANLDNNHKIYLILANDEPTQPYEFSNKLSFNLKTIEKALDFILGAVQRLTRRANQSFRVHETEDLNNFNPEIPKGITDKKGQAVIVNDAGDGFDYGLTTEQITDGKVPTGGDTDAALVKNSNTSGDVKWDNLEISGWSDRFGVAWSSKGLRDTLEKILDLVYAAPLVSLTGSSNIIREKGDDVTSITLSADVTKRSDDIARIHFKDHLGATIQDFNPPSNTGSGITQATYSTTFSDTRTFEVEVTDDGTSGGPTVVDDFVTYTFVYPYYHGTGVAGLTAAQVAALTKDIIESDSDVTYSFTTSANDVYYMAYPASYGNLTSILDENGFETIGDWTKRTENITGLDGNAVSYNIYEFNNPVSAQTTSYRFIR